MNVNKKGIKRRKTEPKIDMEKRYKMLAKELGKDSVERYRNKNEWEKTKLSMHEEFVKKQKVRNDEVFSEIQEKNEENLRKSREKNKENKPVKSQAEINRILDKKESKVMMDLTDLGVKPGNVRTSRDKDRVLIKYVTNSGELRNIVLTDDDDQPIEEQK